MRDNAVRYCSFDSTVKKEPPSLMMMLCAVVVGAFGFGCWITIEETRTDSLALLVGVPAFAWLGGPWRLRRRPIPPSLSSLLLCVLGFVIGWALECAFFLAVAWALLVALWCWACFINPRALRHPELFALLLLSFPWIETDCLAVAWWFRLSGAQISEMLMSSGGYDVVREGTMLSIDGLSIAVGHACSGMQSLQVMLLGGATLIGLKSGPAAQVCLCATVIVAAAWLANVSRVVVTCVLAVTISPSAAGGVVHDMVGVAAIATMFAVSIAILSWIKA